jgi:8-oxo-dGTP pyrophosphatase MutT (NUDIX family)
MKSNTIFCTNCGEMGHYTKQCLKPVTSFGVIVFRVKGGWNQAENLTSSTMSVNGFSATSKLEFLMIQRRDSLGYIDIMRGKYRQNDMDYILQQVRGMTGDEQKRLLTEPFDTLWERLWGPPTDGVNSYKHERELSRVKLAGLISGTPGGMPSLAEMIEKVNHSWNTPEWGFAKGRRDPHETEYGCAIREMREETGLTDRDVIPIRNLEPITEVFYGSNNIRYCHKYYIMYCPKDIDLEVDKSNSLMTREVGDIQWCSLEEGLQRIRSDNVEKREILLRASKLLRNYCAFQLPVARCAEVKY